MVVTIIVIFIGAGILFWYYLAYNRLVATIAGVDQAWSNVEVQLKRRFDLIANLVAVTKGYAVHEKDTLLETTLSRASGVDSSNAEKVNQLLPEINTQVLKLMAIVEAYPDLKADRQFLTLQSELSNSENLIAERRHSYNQCVSLYQNLQLTFPSNLVFMLGAFSPRVFFDAPEEVNVIPKVQIS